jgi:hypothetical protein
MVATGAGRMRRRERGAGRYSEEMDTQPRRPEAAASPSPAAVPAKPSLDGLEDKWTQRWAKERVVQV